MYKFDDWATADAAVEVESDTLNGLFEECGVALERFMAGNVKCTEHKTIKVSSKTLEGLLFSWLNELIYLKDAENFFFASFNVNVSKNDDGYELTADGCGQAFSSEMSSLHDVKSCTYHKLKVVHNVKWSATFVLDV